MNDELYHDGQVGMRWGYHLPGTDYWKIKKRNKQKQAQQFKNRNNQSYKDTTKTVLTHIPGKVGDAFRQFYTTKDDLKKYADSRAKYEHPIKRSISGEVLKKAYEIGKPIKNKYDEISYTSGRKISEAATNVDKEINNPNTLIGAFTAEFFSDFVEDKSKIKEANEYLYKTSEYLNTPLLAIYDGTKYLWEKSGEGSKEYKSNASQRKNPANLMLFGNSRPRVREKK